MAGGSLAWFAADALFKGNGGWYIGSPNGFAVGPYPNEETAMVQSAEVQKRLARSKDGGDRLRVVRSFIQEQGASPVTRAPDVRAGEQPRMWFRTDRCFAVDDRWYFLTREGIDVGPYDSKFDAETDVRRLARLLKQCATDEQRRLAIYEFARRPVSN